MPESKRKLRLLEPGHELPGKLPPGFERIAIGVQVGQVEHVALVHACAAIARWALRQCLAPGPRAPLQEALEQAELHCQGALGLRQLRATRARVFEAARALQQQTLEAVERALRLNPRPGSGPLDSHADSVVLRYAELSAHYAIVASLDALDAALAPRQALDVPKDAAAAIAYRNVGLGPARDPALRRAASEQADWEHRQLNVAGAHALESTALQLFHEYLGVHWKNHVDAQRVYMAEFIAWAFPSA